MTASEEQRLPGFVAERLRRRFPSIPVDVVEATVVGISATFEVVRIRDLIPILVEREARDFLAHLAA